MANALENLFCLLLMTRPSSLESSSFHCSQKGTVLAKSLLSFQVLSVCYREYVSFPSGSDSVVVLC